MGCLIYHFHCSPRELHDSQSCRKDVIPSLVSGSMSLLFKDCDNFHLHLPAIWLP